jgi:hypothetical protein
MNSFICKPSVLAILGLFTFALCLPPLGAQTHLGKPGLSAAGPQRPDGPPPVAVPPHKTPSPPKPKLCLNYSREIVRRTCDAPGFDSFTSRYVKDRYFPYPPDDKEWREQAKPFVPCVVAALNSPDPCIQLAAISLLRDIRDERAVEPLLAFLRKDNSLRSASEDVRQVLACTFKSPAVVPFLVEVLTPPVMDPDWVGYDVQTTRDGIKDPRLFDALYQLYESPAISQEQKDLVLFALAGQRYGPECDDRLLSIFNKLKSRKVCAYGTDRLVLAIANEKTFDDIEAYYFDHWAPGNVIWGAIPGALKQVGGDRYIAFMRKVYARLQDKGHQTWAAREIAEELAKQVPSTLPRGKDILDWLQHNAGETLSSTPSTCLWPMLQKDPRYEPTAGLAEQAGYWEKAASLFAHNPSMESSIQRKLCGIYGPTGTNEPAKELKALTAAIDNYTESMKGISRDTSRQPRGWVDEETALKRQIAVGEESQSLRIVHAVPLTPGNPLGRWKAELILPAGPSKLKMNSDPVGFVDYFGQDGLLASAPATVAIDLSTAGKGPIPFTLRPYPSPEVPDKSITEVRLRLLFLPGKEGFYGAVVSANIKP